MKVLQMKAHRLVVALLVFFASGMAVGYFLVKPDKEPAFAAFTPSTQSRVVKPRPRLVESDQLVNLESTAGIQQKRLTAIREAQAMDAVELVEKITEIQQQLALMQTPTNFLAVYIDSLVALDPMAGAAIYESNMRLRYQGITFYRSWMDQDPVVAIEYYLANPRITQLGVLILKSEAFESLSVQAEVLEAFGSGAQVILNQARILRLPADEALAWVLSDEVSQQDAGLIALIASNFSQSIELSAGLELGQQISESSSRGLFYSSLFNARVIQQPDETFEMINLLFGPGHEDRDLVLRAFLGGGEQASRLVIQHASDIDDYELLASALSRLASYDLDAAMIAFSEIPKQIDSKAISQFAYAVSNSNREVAYDWIKQIGERQPLMRDAILSSLSYKDPKFVERKLSEETDPDLIASMVQQLVNVKSRNEPQAAMALLDQYGDTDSYANSLRNLASQWGNKDPQEMLDYVIDNPDAQGLVNSVKFATASWYKERPDEVLTWLDSVTRQEVLDKGFEGIALTVSNSNPRQALEFTESISPKKRENVRVQIIAGWIAKNTSQMEEILSQVELSDQGQDRIRSYINNL